ncbi:MAG: leucine--tRNA ligase, partial [Verrucomicrobiota bacterium]|nr:leucine--tRNA ligase [Verrucomicrobiota bacterium]
PEGYTATDIVARYKRMRGFNVLHPMGWDAFGLPAEQYAIKTGQHPAVTTRENVAKFKSQLKRIGFSYDWDREVNTTDPRYFRWTQWIFLQIYNSWLNPETQRAEPISSYREADPDSVRLAYVAEVPVNWCAELGTVLANEEVIDGKSEVGGFPVVRRPMRQWMLRITAFAERLIDELDGLDWPDSIKALQRNWIGRSEGAEVEFAIEGVAGSGIRVFTTRPDTLYGATYMVLSPENPLVDAITTDEQRAAVEDYRASVASKSDLERTELAKDKSGVATGAFALNPVNQERIPIWIADYVLMSYGTGAIMAVPAHDERDFEFAQKYQLPIREVVAEEPRSHEAGEVPCSMSPLVCTTGEGFAVHSPLLEGLPTAAAKQKITDWLEERGLGRQTINYKLRDWLFSRQRYWGEPFPIVWREGRHEALPESELPLEPPPLDDFKPTGTGEPPLAKARDWVRYSDAATRETNTMPQWAGSCWYYLRFCDPANDARFVGREAESYWMGGAETAGQARQPGGIDLYVGGTEHAVLHLLYSRFWHKVLFDLGHLTTPEPFQRLVNQGIILGEDGQKMSKSRGNVVNPDDVIDEYGADAFRCYEMFMGPLEQMKPWSMKGVEGVSRFLARVWRLVMGENQAGEWELSAAVVDAPAEKPQLKVLHATIKKVGEDIETLSFNTAISQMMILVNSLTNAPVRSLSAVRTLLVLLNPFAPHLTSELWETLGSRFENAADITAQSWPSYDPQLLIEDDVEIVVQVNGKLRDKIVVALTATEAEIEAAAMASAKIQEHIAGKTIRKIVIVPKKLVNVVVS